ncbi:MAG: hypothetical protein KatS3mg023_2292 [Armatimonadota bacterium]|nr:MAG: hypothetical protein KatS3mg023_2292 [Armatimonadota bacterium]
MWQRVRSIVTRQILWAHVLSLVTGRRSRQRELLPRWVDHVAKLAQQLPPEEACNEVCRTFWVLPAHAMVSLVRHVEPLCVQDKRNLLLMAENLAFHGEYDEAQLLLWRGIRLHETDSAVWECALRISLEHLLRSASYEEWQRSFHRYKYLVAHVPHHLQAHPAIVPYLTFGAEGEEREKNLSTVPPFCVWLWQRGELSEARQRMHQWWGELRLRENVPEPAARVAVWYMLGLGLFGEIASDERFQQLYPNDVRLASWFNGSPLPRSQEGSGGNMMTWLALWSQYLMEFRRPPIALVWRACMAAHHDSEIFLTGVLSVATYGLRRQAWRKHFTHRFERSRVAWFLPYLHFLCVATARLQWQPETREIWKRIQSFEVDYARKEELRHFLHQCFPQAEWE